MGYGKKRVQRRDFNKSRDDSWRDKRPKTDYLEKEDLRNPAFEEYYKAQGIVPEDEWESFMAILKKPLPTTFRINGSGQYANDLRDKMMADFFAQLVQGDIMVDGEKVEPPHPLPWYPNNYAWHMNFSRNQLRKLPILEAFHDFMKKANEAGTITRQEAVSMVPPLFLDVQPSHRVLDMCAAPGSKTFQLLEALHAGDKLPEGFVVANDADAQRCNLLTHQTKRMCSPCLVVTNHEAQNFPMITSSTLEGDTLYFDRILCDVPCSGDGTLRKAPDIWRRWSVNNGNGLHVLQLKISLQACRLLKVGGRMVYSTCSFNPVEDEAVVAELLRRTHGCMQLLEVGDQLNNLKRTPGLRQWKVKDRYRWYGSWEEAKDVSYKLDPSMFPGSGEDLPLERCMRFLPHHQDTGGFFVAVLEKVADLPADIANPSTRHRWLKPDGGEMTAEEEMAMVLDGLKACASTACGAAEAALAALDAQDEAGIQLASKTTQAALAKVEMALKELRQSEKYAGYKPRAAPASGVASTSDAGAAQLGEVATAEAPAQEEQEEEAAMLGNDAAAGDVDAEEDVIVMAGEDEAPDMLGDAEDAPAADAGPEDDDMAEPNTAAEADGEAAPGAEADAAGAASVPAVNPSWVRGGGGRNRGVAAAGRFRGIDPVLPLEDATIIANIVDFYGVSPTFPMGDQLISRTLEVAKPKRLYFITKAIRDMLVADEKEALKITSLGLKLFERQDVKEGYGKCSYRIAQEGLPLLLPYISQQLAYMRGTDLLRLVKERSVLLPPNSDPEAPPGSIAEPPAPPRADRVPFTDPELAAQLRTLPFGCCVCTLRPQEAAELGMSSSSDGAAGSLTANAPLAICVWRTKASLAVLVDKAECSQIASKLGSAIFKRGQAEGR